MAHCQADEFSAALARITPQATVKAFWRREQEASRCGHRGPFTGALMRPKVHACCRGRLADRPPGQKNPVTQLGRTPGGNRLQENSVVTDCTPACWAAAGPKNKPHPTKPTTLIFGHKAPGRLPGRLNTLVRAAAPGWPGALQGHSPAPASGRCIRKKQLLAVDLVGGNQALAGG